MSKLNRPIGLVARVLVALLALMLAATACGSSASQVTGPENNTGSDTAAPDSVSATDDASDDGDNDAADVEPVPTSIVAITTPVPATVVPTTDATTQYRLQPPPIVPAYDTAWEVAYLATNAEIVLYLDHLYESGFSGFWFLALPFGGTNLYQREIPDVGDNIANVSDAGQVTLSNGYTQRIAFILDEAERRHLGVGLVAAWAKANSCKTTGVTAGNAFDYGVSIGTSFNHPAIDYWVLGGDLPYEEKCVGAGPRRILEDVSVQLEAGIRSAGAEQPTAFHTGAGVKNYDQLFDAEYVDVGAVQTGHCQDAATMKAKLGPVVARTDKPVILAESRYYQLAPNWPGCLHSKDNPVSADDIRADVEAAIEIGVAGVLFGDGQRYQWCRDKSDNDVFDLVGPDYDCLNGIQDTFRSLGEMAFLQAVKR